MRLGRTIRHCDRSCYASSHWFVFFSCKCSALNNFFIYYQTACLRDPTPAVRKQTLVLLIHLLQEDYLKIRGTFFFRILQLANDDDEGLRELALFYVTQRLLHRQPTIIQQHFIECVFHFNDYKGHPTYNKFLLTDREKTLFSISGFYRFCLLP